jgi:hypothetical protein
VSALLVRRQTVRIANAGTARRTARCEARGHCGPFANEAFYNDFPESMWHGMGDCLECGTTCHVPSQLQRYAEAVLPGSN